MNVVIGKAALADLESALEWYRHRNPSAAIRLLDEFESAIDLLGRAPAIGPVRGQRRSKDIRLLSLARFPYSLWYVAEEARVVVVAVAHQRRRPRYRREKG